MDHLNLYLDLEPGERADLEVVAKSSLAFAHAIREIAYIVDPSLSIKIEFESGTEGSLSLNSVVKFIKEQIPDPVTRKVIIVTVALWFAKEFGAAVLGVVVSTILTDDPSISQQDVDRIANKVHELLQQDVGKRPVQEVYRELHKDPSVKGVGVTIDKAKRPDSIVPRNKFPERMGQAEEPIEEQKPRSRTERMMLTLISPVLQRNSNKWRFLSKDGTIYAAIKDEEFLNDIISGRANIPMRGGILLWADVEIIETKDMKNKVWVVSERNIIKVLDLITDGGSSDLFPIE